MSRHRLLAALLAGCLAMTACGSGSGSTGTSGSSQNGFPRTIQHAMGQTTIPKQPLRVAALDASFVGAVLALDTEVVAYTKYRSYNSLPDYLGADRKYGKNAKAIGELESPDVEQLYDIKPDLIVSAKVRHEKFYNEFTKIAPTVFTDTTAAAWKTNMRLVAKALGKESLADQKIAAYEARARKIGAAIKAKLGKAATVSVVRFVEGEPTVRLYSSNSFPGTVMADAGLTRPAGQPDSKDKISNNLSQEDILKLDASTVFVSTYTDPKKPGDSPIGQFQANPLWKKLTGKVVTVSDTTWFTSVSIQGAQSMLTDLAKQYGVDPSLT
jgi:iron complex transport system substrate-binding protein